MAGLEGTSEIIRLQPPRHNQSFQPLHQAFHQLKDNEDHFLSTANRAFRSCVTNMLSEW